MYNMRVGVILPSLMTKASATTTERKENDLKRERINNKSKRECLDHKPYNNKYLMSVAHGLSERISFFLTYRLWYISIYIYSYAELSIRKKININSFSCKLVGLNAT